MVEQDIFVGIVAVLTGLFVFCSAALDSEWVGRFWIARHIENNTNGSLARYVIMAIGALCVILGTLLILGFFPGDKTRNTELSMMPVTESLPTAK